MVFIFIWMLLLLLYSGNRVYGHADGTHMNGVRSARDWYGENMARSNHPAKTKSMLSVGCRICRWALDKLKKSIGHTNITKERIEGKLKGIWILNKPALP
ncbi:uncharacterized protein gnly isoform X2 [Alosa pseudoharengus]|uniref:uncharacterized protein gnly isoform X2 n=1 Tax=Alosa pseudoharengus TaxID=34774 RepID=UPI003F8CDE5E